MKDRIPELKCTTREHVGTRYSKRYRAEGKLPGVIYGHGQPPVPVNFEAEDAVRHFEAGEKVFRLDFPGTSNADEHQMVLLKELQFDYLGDTVVHADFARVDLNERVRTKVHIELKGDAKGLKAAGAILMHPTNEIEIECRVADLPESIAIDITELDMDQMISAGQVKLPAADMKLITDPNAVVAQIIEAKEEVVAEATAATAESTQPEVIGEKERLEKAAAAEAGKPGAKPAAGAPAKDAKAAAPAAKK